MPLLNRCGGGGLKINGIIESYLIAAGENISAGDFVNFINEAEDEIAKNRKFIMGDSAAYESSATIYKISATALSSTSVLVTYQDYDNSYYGTAVILTISGTTITPGTPTVFNSAYTDNISSAALSSTSVLVAYTDGGNSNYGTAVIFTISDTTITVGTPVVFEGASTSYIYAVALSSTSVLVAYQDFTNSRYGTSIVLTISDTTITVGTPVVFESAVTSRISVAVLSSTNVLVAYQDEGNSDYGTAVVLTISDTTITVGTPVVFESAETDNISVAALSSTSVLVAYQDGGNSDSGTTVVLTISDTTITPGTPTVFNSSSTYYISATAISLTNVLITYSDGGNSDYGMAVVLAISDTTITVGTPVIFNSRSSSYISTVFFIFD